MSEDKLSNMVFKPCGHNIEESCWHNNLGKASEEIFRLKSEVEELKNERAALYKSNHAFIETVEQLKSEVEIPNKFIIPGDTPDGGALDLARTIVRRAERMAVKLLHDGVIQNGEVVRYLNRLSDLIFILARYVEVKSSLAELPE